MNLEMQTVERDLRDELSSKYVTRRAFIKLLLVQSLA